MAPVDAATLWAAASDVALVVDRHGVIEDVAIGLDDLPAAELAGWVGQAWSDIVTAESRPKVAALLDEAGQPGARGRHVNHVLQVGSDLPVRFSSVPLARGRVLALGHDMRGQAHLQHRMVDAQQALEREYWRLRNVQTRYQLLFEGAAEAVLVVDAASGRVLDANPAVEHVLGQVPRKLQGQSVDAALPDRMRRDFQALLGRVRASGRSEELALRVQSPRRLELQATVSLVTQDDKPQFLVRLRPLKLAQAGAIPARQAAMWELVQRMPDGFVVTDTEGRVQSANAAFVELAQLVSEEQLLGESIGRWLGRPGLDMNVMLATLRQQGSLRLFATVARGEHGVEAEVEISGIALPEAEPPCLGFCVRHVGRRLEAAAPAGRGVPRSVEQLTQLVGRMPLKDLVRESTDLIEQLCIQAALQLTRDNRASAAEMLGLSRQSLYVKLRRYGLLESGADQAD